MDNKKINKKINKKNNNEIIDNENDELLYLNKYKEEYCESFKATKLLAIFIFSALIYAFVVNKCMVMCFVPSRSMENTMTAGEAFIGKGYVGNTKIKRFH